MDKSCSRFGGRITAVFLYCFAIYAVILYVVSVSLTDGSRSAHLVAKALSRVEFFPHTVSQAQFVLSAVDSIFLLSLVLTSTAGFVLWFC